MLNLKGRGALIAGTRRIGQDVVRRLVAEGVRPAIIYRSSEETAAKLRDEALQRVDKACIVQADLTVEADVERAVAEAKRELGDLSFLVNMASDYPRVPFDKLNAEAWDRGIAAAKANFLLALAVSKELRRNPGPTRGHMIFFGDWAAGETPYEDFLPYLSAKASIDFQARGFALELAKHGILVNAILPGPTQQAAEVTNTEWQEALQDTPLGRESSAEDIAEIIVTLLKLETITGETIRIDAGRHIAGNRRSQ